MNNSWKNYQIVDINDNSSRCDNCGFCLSNLDGFSYAGESRTSPTTRDELCRCRNCGQLFILHYELFDSEGHIFSKVFSGDINDVNFQWYNLLSDEQKTAISNHLEKCKECQDRLSEELLTDAWLSDFINNLRKGGNQPYNY